MAEQNSDLYEEQLLAVFQSCLIKGENELNENNLFSICNKLHLDGLIEELKLCICKHRPDKQTISFQEFRDGLLLLLKKSQELITNKHQIIPPCYNLSTCNFDIEKGDVLSLINSISKAYSQNLKTNATMDENRLIHLWEKIKIYLSKGNTDFTTIQFVSTCLGIPELPKQITESIFEGLDRNCDGLISFDEFIIIFQKKIIEASQENILSHNSIVNCDVNTLDFNACKSREINSIQINRALDEKKVASGSNITVLSCSEDLNTLDTSLAEITNIICDELKNLDQSLDTSIIQSHISLLREMITVHQDEQRNLSAVIENMKAEKEKMRNDMLEANERANLLAQEIDEYQVQLEKTTKDIQKQSEQRYAEITKELSDQLNIEREMDAAVLKSKDNQLQMLQKEYHDMKNKVVNILQDNQMLEAENKTLLNQIDKLRQSNNDLLNQIKVLDAEHDEIQNIETKQQEQVDFFVERIKQLQSELTLLRDQNDELNVELENFRCPAKDVRYKVSSSLAYDLQANESLNTNHLTITQQVDAKIPFALESPMNDKQIDAPSDSNAIEYRRLLGDRIIKDIENVLLTSARCTASDKCDLRNGISRLITDLRVNIELYSYTRNFGKSIASELETECEERANESLRDLVISKISKPPFAKRTTISNSMDFDHFTDQDVRNVIPSKMTSLRDYPPRREEQTVDQFKTNKEKNISSIINATENVPKVVITNVELLEIEKKQLAERCQEFERSLDLLKTEYEECEDYWAAKLEEERQLFEQEQKISDDKLTELINKIAEYEELISPLDKSKNNGRLSPIEEKFNLEQQYIDLEEEFEKWRIKAENDISQRNLEIQNLHERLKLAEQQVGGITNDCYVQIPDEISVPALSDSSHCKSSSISSIPSTNETFVNLDLCDTNNQTSYSTSTEFLLSSNSNTPLKQKNHVGSHNIMLDSCTEYSLKKIKNMNKDQKVKKYQNNVHVGTRNALMMNEEYKSDDSEFKSINDIMKEINYPCAQSDAQQQQQQQHVCCVDLSILQNLKIKLYTQEQKKRHLQHYVKQQRQCVEKLLQRTMIQHQTEVFELQCLLRDTQQKLQIQVQISVSQADKLASADILVKDLYIENAYLTANMKRLQERCLVLTGLDVGTTSM